MVFAALSLAIGSVFLLAAVGRSDVDASVPPVALTITSQPQSASVVVDQHAVGRTPLDLRVTPGNHVVDLKGPNVLDAHYALDTGVDGAALRAVLWRRQPLLSRLRSTLPGAELSSARLLADGQVALSIALPAGQQLQAWQLDPESGAVQSLVTDARGSRLVVSPDATLAALLGREVGPPSRDQSPSGSRGMPATVLWLLATGDAASVPLRGWRAPLARGEHLADVSWSPDGRWLLLASILPLGGRAAMSRLWFVDTGTLEATEAATLPSEVLAGSEQWSPDGHHVAFVAHAGAINALCLLDRLGAFRYVADLDIGEDPVTVYAAGVWSADSQQLVFVAPRQRPPGAPTGWLQPPAPTRAIYVASVDAPSPRWVADTTVDSAAWREDGQILGLGRLGADGALDLRLMDTSPGGQHLVELPLKPAAGYAAVWDAAHARLLIAVPNAPGPAVYWLARLGWEEHP
jgi:hypothetical protein